MITGIWLPLKTIVMIIGVLEWQDPSLTTYPKENRSDQKFYETLIDRGVSKDNIIYLQDKQATRATIISSMEKVLMKSDASSTFLFYYAGHGTRSTDCTKGYFLNYDCNTADLENKCFPLSKIEELVKADFKGSQAIFTADCCYSGMLNTVADHLAKTGIASLVFTSALSSNTSTGAWTFTESLNEVFSGKPYISKPITEINIRTAGDYIAYNMAYANQQKANFYYSSNFPADFVIGPMKADFSGKDHIGDIKRVWWKDKYYYGRIVDENKNLYHFHYFGWDEKWDEWLTYEKMLDPEFKTYDVKSKVDVEWSGKWYPAMVLKVDGIFHYIKYNDWSDEWNEWVTADRMKQK